VTRADDIFISYAHADDEVPQGARSGWVTTLVGELRKILRRKLGGDGAEIWMDHQLAADAGVSDELRARLRESRTLVLVMSPGYQRSDWCQRELANFLLASESKRIRANVFVIEIEPVDRATWPRALRDLELTPVRFWSRELDDAAPVLQGYPLPPLDGSSLYWRNLNELAHWIAARLSAPAAPADTARIVLVAETTDDLDEQRESVAALLRQQHFEPVPLRGYPRDTQEAYLQALRNDMREASLFVQLLGPYEGKRLGDGEPLVPLQAREALAAHRDRSLKILQWRESGLDLASVKSESHRLLLSGPNVRASGIEEFRRAIVDALTNGGGPTSPELVAGAARAQTFSIFVQADTADRDLGNAVVEALKAIDVVPVIPSPDDAGESFARGLEHHREALRRSAGVVFVYGQASLGWLTARVSYAAQGMGLGRRNVWGAVVDSPSGRPKIPFASKNLVTIDFRDGFDPTKIASFVDTLRLQTGRAGD
jgi:TIR domain-containing protein